MKPIVFSTEDLHDPRIVVSFFDPTALMKAWMKQIPTMVDPKTGVKRIDYKKVPTGGTIWITIKKPDSPLRGRHIPITKRPDGKFAIDFESARKRGYNFGDWAKKISAVSHAPLSLAEPREALAEEEAKHPPKQLSEAELATEKERMAALSQKKGEIRKQKEVTKKEAQTTFQQTMAEMESSGELGKQNLADFQKEIEEKADERDDWDDDTKKAFVQQVMDAAMRQDATIRAMNVKKLREAANTGKEFVPEKTFFEIPDPKEVEGSNKYEVQVKTSQKIEEAKKTSEAPKSGEIVRRGIHAGIALGADINAEAANKALKNPKTAKRVYESLTRYEQLRLEERSFRQQMRSLANLNGVEIDAFKVEKNVTDEDIKEYEAEIEKLQGQDETNFYEHVATAGGDDAAMAYYPHNLDGASAALTSLVARFGGTPIQMRDLISGLGVEGATMAAASMLYDRLGEADFKKQMQKLEDFNSENQPRAEKQAIERYQKLKAKGAEIERQAKSGELVTPDTIELLRNENLLAQRRELGIAQGSLAASGSLLWSMQNIAGTKGVGTLRVNCGTLAAAMTRMKALGLQTAEGKAPLEHYIVRNDDGTHSIKVNTKELSPYLDHIQIEGEKALQNTAIANNSDAITNDDVPPFFKAGAKPRNAMQRNSIDWLVHNKGGLVAASTGFGKTYVAAAFIAKRLKAEPNTRHIFIADRGRAEGAAADFDKFVEAGKMPQVVIASKPPKGMDRAAWHQQNLSKIMGLKEGQTLVMDNTAANRYSEALGKIEFDTGVIDEPHQLFSPTGKMTEKGRELMKRLAFKHRIATTATPAKENVTHVYDLLRWTTHGAVDKGISKKAFVGLYNSLGQGTNAQDGALTGSLRDMLSPYMISDREKDRGYTVSRHRVEVKRSPDYIAQQKKLEGTARGKIDSYMKKNESWYRKEYRTVAPDGESSAASQGLWNSIAAQMRRETGTEPGWETVATQYRKEGGTFRTPWKDHAHTDAVKEIMKEHRGIFNASIHSDKTAQAIRNVEQMRQDRHIVYVENKTHYELMKKQFDKLGISTMSLLNEKDTQSIADDWQKKAPGEVPVLFLSQREAAGINIAAANKLHVVGTPNSAADLIQVFGRADRTSDLGKGRDHLDIFEYRFSDNPLEDHLWTPVDQQYKMLSLMLPATRLPGESLETL